MWQKGVQDQVDAFGIWKLGVFQSCHRDFVEDSHETGTLTNAKYKDVTGISLGRRSAPSVRPPLFTSQPQPHCLREAQKGVRNVREVD